MLKKKSFRFFLLWYKSNSNTKKLMEIRKGALHIKKLNKPAGIIKAMLDLGIYKRC